MRRCAGCKRRIPRSEPDLILRCMDPENPVRTALKLAYHVRCRGAALERITAAPALWRMTYRHVEAGAN
jgi:hypothetical protein